MATRVSTYELPDGQTANQTDNTQCWRIVQNDVGDVIMAADTIGITRTMHTMIADDNPDAVAAALTAPPWQANQAYTTENLVERNGIVYHVNQGHTSQADWTPDIVPALFTPIGAIGSSGPQPWTQPLGAHDAYNTGDRVTFQGSTYESTSDANVWSPTAHPAGWTLIE